MLNFLNVYKYYITLLYPLNATVKDKYAHQLGIATQATQHFARDVF
jgi:hypothetical protein